MIRRSLIRRFNSIRGVLIRVSNLIRGVLIRGSNSIRGVLVDVNHTFVGKPQEEGIMQRSSIFPPVMEPGLSIQ